MSGPVRPLRVAFVAGTLARGGAERQLVLTAGALRRAGVDVRVFTLTQGEHHEDALRAEGIPVVWVGRRSQPPIRLLALSSALRRLSPDIVHAAHFFTNLYAAMGAAASGALGIGTIRSDVTYDLERVGRWGRSLLRAPRALIANSYAGRDNAVRAGVPAAAVHVLANTIDLAAFDAAPARPRRADTGNSKTVVVTVGRLVRAKRLDVFLAALARARREVPGIEGVVLGDGPERSALETAARDLGLAPVGVTFLGTRDDVPAILRDANVFVSASDHEGFPNVLLEAMAARLPVVGTPAGDTSRIVVHGETGYIVPFRDPEAIAARLIELSGSPATRERLGTSGRERAERDYDATGLAGRLLAVYRRIAERQARADLVRRLSHVAGTVPSPPRCAAR